MKLLPKVHHANPKKFPYPKVSLWKQRNRKSTISSSLQVQLKFAKLEFSSFDLFEKKWIAVTLPVKHVKTKVTYRNSYRNFCQ